MAAASANVPQITLNNGITIPHIGLGTWQIKDPNEVGDAVRSALDIGYRLIDTAAIYGNEEGVGTAVRYHETPREEIFVTSKLWNDSHDYDSALRAFDATMERLGLDYLDMYLIHWPVPSQNKFTDAWRALESLYQDKRVRAIGVSNFKTHHLSTLLESASITPAVNQIELHPRLQQTSTREFCATHNIAVESYSPIMRADKGLARAVDPIAAKHHKTPAQIILRWHIDNGLLPIPKSTNGDRQRENFSIFDFSLDEEDMQQMADLNEEQIVVADPDSPHWG